MQEVLEKPRNAGPAPSMSGGRAWARAALPLIAALALPGCALSGLLGAPAPAPEAEVAVPADWAVSEVPPVELEIARYWQRLNDPLITELVEQAIAENRDLAQALARVDQAQAGLRAARAGYFPALSASGSVDRNFGNGASDTPTFAVGGDASWELDLFGQISSDVAASRADLSSAGYALADLQRLIAGQVAIAAINARSTARQLAIARDTLGYQDENLQIARWRNQAGLVSSLDVEQARTQRAQTAATIPALESSLAATANAISTLIGEPPGRVLEALQEPAGVPAPDQLSGFEAPPEIIARRPDVRAAEASLFAAAARIGIARAQLLPLVRLGGSVGSRSVGLDDLFDIVTGNIFASVSQLLFDGGRAAAQVDGAEAAARGAQAAWEQAILIALEEVESAAVDQRAANERVAINEEAVDAANNSALLARSQYQAGLTDFQTLLGTESQLLAARNSLVAAEADRASAFVRLTQALGGGWQDEQAEAVSGGETEQ